MKLWEIHAEVERLANRCVWDPEKGAYIDYDTGEIMTEDALREEFERLDMDRLDIMKYLAKLVINLRAEAKAHKEEETRLKERREKIEKKEERLLSILDRECNGQKTDLEVATFNYRKTASVDIVDPETALAWLQEHHEEAVKYKEPEISKTEIKRIFKAGENVPGVRIAEGVSGVVEMTRAGMRLLQCVTCSMNPATCEHDEKPELDAFGRCKYHKIFLDGGLQNEQGNFSRAADEGPGEPGGADEERRHDGC